MSAPSGPTEKRRDDATEHGTADHGAAEHGTESNAAPARGERSWLQTLTGFDAFPGARWLAALGVLAAGALAVEANVYGARHFARWDFTSDRAFTLSEPTLTLLGRLDRPTEIVSLLPKSDPLAVDARHLLDAYRAASPAIRVRFIDPERDVAEFLALGEKSELVTEASGGVPFSEASFLLRQGDRRWFVQSRELVSSDDAGRMRVELEARLTEGLARLQENERVRVCFLTGHGEPSVDDASGEGLGELTRRLSQQNLEPIRVPLDVPDPTRALEGCPVVALVGPERPLPRSHEDALLEAWGRGQALLLLVDPIVSSSGALAGWGLDRLLARLGLRSTGGFVIEREPARRLPRGIGESFFAEPAPHSITRGLSTEETRTDARVVVTGASSFELVPGGSAVPLLTTSERASLLGHLDEIDALGSAPAGKQILGAATSHPASAPATKDRRAVVLATSSPVLGASFRSPELYGNRVLVDAIFSWLVQRPELVRVPERPARPAGLTWSEESLGELLRYVLLYMPGAAASLGLFVLLRRRSLEARSREERSS